MSTHGGAARQLVLPDFKKLNQSAIDDSKHHKLKMVRECSMCQRIFITSARYRRFCDECKTTERYKYSEWMGTGAVF